MMPRQERFEPMVVDKISEAIFESARLSAGTGIDADFEIRANKVYLYLKHKILNETFDFDESDSNELIGTRKNHKNDRKKPE